MEVGGIETADDAASLIKRLERFDTIIVGPGLEPASKAFVNGLVAGFGGALVLDAGALNVLTPSDIAARKATTVLTPHTGEFNRLSGEEPTPAAAAELAASTGAIVVLKGNPTIVAAGRSFVITSGGPELATIGSGDVLAGLIGAFVSTLPDPVAAVASAVHIHGVAGQVLDDVSVVTTPDLVAAIGPTVAAYRR